MLVWSGDASPARAGCGDDLMPLHTNDAAVGDTVGNAAAEKANSAPLAEPLKNRLAPRPCDGPGCGETPPDEPGLVAVPQPHRSGTGATALAGVATAPAPPTIIGRYVVVSEGTASFVPVAVFRPPSTSLLR